MRALVEYFLNKSIFVNLSTILILLVGGYTIFHMNREAFPNIDFDIVTVVTVYPGASPKEVEKLVTNPLEEAIKEVDGLEEYRSSSIEGRSGIVIKIDPDVEDTDKVVDDIRSAVDRVNDLPDDIEEDPVVTEISTARQPVIEVSVSLKEDDDSVEKEIELRNHAKILEDAILDQEGVAKISRKGWRELEMQVSLLPQMLQRLHISSQLVIDALRLKNVNFPGGTIASGDRELLLRTMGEFNASKEVEKVHVRTNELGRTIRVRDVAHVREGLEEAVYLDRVNGKKSVTLTVIKRERSDAIEVVENTKATLDAFRKKYGNQYDYQYVNDLSKYIRRRLGVLLANGISGMILVTASLFVFLGWRVALMTALGIPVSFCAAMILMNFLGITLNLISMFGLIIVVGIIVDDAIIICENVYSYIEEGMPVYEATLKGTQEVLAPVTATITTTVAAFAPMLYMTGIFGKFIYSIPLVVILALISSVSEAFFILPSHLYDINKHHVHKQEIKGESGWFRRFKDGFYLRILKKALLHPGKTYLFLFALLVFAFVLQIKKGHFKLFPGAIEIFQIKFTAPNGMDLSGTSEYVRAVESAIEKLPREEVENYVTRIGITQKDPNDPFTKRGENYGQIMVYLTPDAERERSTEEIIADIRHQSLWLLPNDTRILAEKKSLEEIEQIEDKELRERRKKIEESPVRIPDKFASLQGQLPSIEFEKRSGGPPVGKPIAVEIRGDNFEVLDEIGSKYKMVLTKVPGVIDIGDDRSQGKDELRIKVDESLASLAGVNVSQIGTAINTAFQGSIATTIKRAEEEVEVRVRFPESYRKSVASLDGVYVTNSKGNLIPVSKLIQYERKPGFSNINHLDGKRLLTVTANLNEAATTPREANLKLEAMAEGIIGQYPGYRVRYGGENKDTEESLASLGRAFGVGFLIIFMILASLFGSFLQPIIVVTAVPFSFIGVILAFVTHGEPFSFLAFLGIVGLAGVVVNDSIVLVDYANQLRKQNPKIPLFDCMMETGSKRLRPVILTTVTTVLGLLPTAYGIGGSDPFLVPMALAFGWGLAFSSAMTLVLVPVTYLLVAKWQAKLRKLLWKE